MPPRDFFRISARLLSVVAVFTALGCSGGDEDDGPGGGSCIPNQSSACTCDDGNPGAHASGAAEVNDGLDNQCPGEPGYGSIDELVDDHQIAPFDIGPERTRGER